MFVSERCCPELFQTESVSGRRRRVFFGGKKKETAPIAQRNVPTLVNPHAFSGRQGLLEQERWEAEGECGGGGRKHEDGGGSACFLSAVAAAPRRPTMKQLSQRVLRD